MSSENIIEVKNLSVSYLSRKKLFSLKSLRTNAVDDVSFIIRKGETTGLVGESGCGKTTIAKVILKLLDRSISDVKITGEINFNLGNKMTNILTLTEKEMRKFRNRIQIIFQDPYYSLNPRFSIGKIIEEPLVYNTNLNKTARKEKVKFLMEKTGISPDKYNCYPFEFSGGQRQRVSIARAIATNPELLIADEPVSALDVSIQAQILNLLMDLQKDFKLSILLISHDLSVVKQISKDILVMYMGKIIESGEARKVYFDPEHSYTKLLISSIPGYQKQI